MRTLIDREVNKLVFSPPDPGCVLYPSGLPGGSSKIYDRSPYGNHGTITGATWKRLPSGLWYLDFDGSDDKIACGSNSSLLPDAFTVLAWVKPSTDTNQPLLRFGSAGTPAIHIQGWTTGKPIIYMNGENFRYFVTTAWDTLKDGSWHLVGFALPGAAQADISSSQMFIDDAEITASTTVATGAQLSKTQLDIGFAAGDGKLTGSLALFRLINSVLNTFDIQNVFNREKHLFGVW